jgi:hypothetical protein
MKPPAVAQTMLKLTTERVGMAGCVRQVAKVGTRTPRGWMDLALSSFEVKIYRTRLDVRQTGYWIVEVSLGIR